VLALGRLGTCEFDLGSDADLLFLRDERADPQAATRAASRIPCASTSTRFSQLAK
jgi:glutamine synthetase adenylyltransferase